MKNIKYYSRVSDISKTNKMTRRLHRLCRLINIPNFRTNRIKSYLGFLRSSRALKVQNLFRVSPPHGSTLRMNAHIRQ